MKNMQIISFYKGLAILAIVLCHFFLSFEDCPKILSKYSIIGELGCEIFFTLSAFGLCMSSSKKNERLMSFYKRRIINILPGYWTAIVLYVILGFVSVRCLGINVFDTDSTFANIIPNFLLIHGVLQDASNQVVRGGWFVGTLVLLYALFPLLKYFYFRCLRSCRRYITFPLIIILVSTLTIVAIKYVNNEWYEVYKNSFLYRSFINQIISFSIGFSLYDVFNKTSIKYPLIKACICFAICVFLYFRTTHLVIIPALISLSLLYVMVGKPNCPNNNVFYNTISSYGKISMGIYYTHFFIVCEFISIINRYLIGNTTFNVSLRLLMCVLIALPLVYFIGKLFCNYERKVKQLIIS